MRPVCVRELYRLVVVSAVAESSRADSTGPTTRGQVAQSFQLRSESPARPSGPTSWRARAESARRRVCAHNQGSAKKSGRNRKEGGGGGGGGDDDGEEGEGGGESAAKNRAHSRQSQFSSVQLGSVQFGSAQLSSVQFSSVEAGLSERNVSLSLKCAHLHD